MGKVAHSQSSSIARNVVAEYNASHARFAGSRFPHQQNLLLLGLLDLLSWFTIGSGDSLARAVVAGGHDDESYRAWGRQSLENDVDNDLGKKAEIPEDAIFRQSQIQCSSFGSDK